MYNYILKRILLMIPTLFGAAFLVFFLLRLIPGDVCELRLAGTGLYADPAEIELCQEKLGLNQPMIVQFFDFLIGIVTFDLGESMWTGKPIFYEMGLRFELSLQIAIMATITSIFIAIPLGTISAIKQDTWIDYVVRTFSIAGIAIPSFWYGILIVLGILIFTQSWFGEPWMPPLDYVPIWVDPMAESIPVDLACTRHRLSLFRRRHKDDPFGNAGGTTRRLHPNCQSKRVARKSHHQPPCPEKLLITRGNRHRN